MITEVLNMDAVVESLMASVIEYSKFAKMDRWEKGKKLKVLMVGYNGARNTGADVRVEAMAKQFYHVLGRDNVRLGIMTLDAGHSSTYYKPPTELIQFSSVFFKALLKQSSAYHMAVLSEGSCFKSKFANALTTFFFGAAGIMKTQGKPCIAYGSEAGEMDALLEWFVRRYCDRAYIISRTEPSRKIAEALGLDGTLGTDTAWTFPPGPAQWARDILKKSGWDGARPVIAAAVINPFYWPVRPNLAKFVRMKLARETRTDNYDKWYFFSTSPDREKKFNDYIDAVARSMDHAAQKFHAFPVIIGMERLDRGPCHELKKRMKHEAPVFCSEDYNGYELTSILWQLSMLITSRYHARVLSMPAGVPSGAISMDERLENLLSETGHIKDFYIKAQDPQLSEKLPPLVEKLWAERGAVREQILRTIPGYLRKMAAMGKEFKQFVGKNFPELPLPPDPDRFLDYLPPLYPELEKIVEKYG
jgi:polysaccharide pyruvyl transferase WcaK-like protein